MFVERGPGIGRIRRLSARLRLWMRAPREVVVFRALPWVEASEHGEILNLVRCHPPEHAERGTSVLEILAKPLAKRIHQRARRNDACYLLDYAGRGVGFGWVRFSGGLPLEPSGLHLGLSASEVGLFDICLAPAFSGSGLSRSFFRSLRRQFAGHPVLTCAEIADGDLCRDLTKAGFEPWLEVSTIRRMGRRVPTGLRFPHGRLVAHECGLNAGAALLRQSG